MSSPSTSSSVLGVARLISLVRAYRTSFMPMPATAEMTYGFLRDAAFQLLDAFLDRLRVQRIALCQRHDLFLFHQLIAIRLELPSNGLVGTRHIL